VQDRIGELDRRQHDRGDGDVRQCLARDADQPRSGLVADARRVADANAAALAGGERAHVLPERVGVARERPAALEQVAPGLGQRDLVRRAVQQLDPELALEQPDLPAHRRLRDVQLVGGAAEALGARDGNEVPEPAKVEHPLIMPNRSGARSTRCVPADGGALRSAP
jgi:hypothetical protein